jgi:hypothetical protein
MLSTHLRLGLPSGLFPSGFPTKEQNIVWSWERDGTICVGYCRVLMVQLHH